MLVLSYENCCGFTRVLSKRGSCFYLDFPSAMDTRDDAYRIPIS